jgi:DNA-entry nuclease
MKKMSRKNIIILLYCVAIAAALLGCAFSGDKSSPVGAGSSEDVVSDTADDVITETTAVELITEESEELITEKTTEQVTIEGKADKSMEASNTDPTSNDLSNNSQNNGALSTVNIPSYSGKAFIEINDNIPYFSEDEKKSTEAFEKYSELDSLGRCGVAFANICKEIMPTEERGEIGDVKPSGWHTVKYPEIIEDRYLYNRSHLIAYSLAGENANVKNLITGTRYLNQETMQIFELKVLDYVRSTENHVLYRVTPVFEGDNLLAEGVQMEAWSVEDEGQGICFNVFCFNVQPGIEIDYATGESKVAEDSATSKNSNTEDTEETEESSTEVDVTTEVSSEKSTEVSDNNNDNETDYEKQTRTYILNTNSMKIHLPDCRSVGDMAEHNKLEYEGSISDLKKKGYTPCGRCLAEYR